MRRILPFAMIALSLAIVVVIAGCSSEPNKSNAAPVKPASSEVKTDPKIAPKEDVKVAAKANEPWGDVTGRIIWGGDPKIAVAAPLKLGAAGAGCPPVVMDESWVVDPKNGGLRDTFIWLEHVEKGGKLAVHPSLKDVKPDTVEVDQPGCAFVAHAFAMREGQTLLVKNTSAIAHNFKWTGDPTVNPGGGVLLPPNVPNQINGLKASRLPILFECNIHPWMKGYFRVYDHPYYAVSDADGKFTIKNAPAGECRIKVWHGSGGWLDGAKGKTGRPLTVNPGENNLGEIKYAPPQ